MREKRKEEEKKGKEGGNRSRKTLSKFPDFEPGRLSLKKKVVSGRGGNLDLERKFMS